MLGMHRSGTSFLTGSLQQAGLELHRFHEQNPHNKKGNRENQDIVELNNWVLDESGGSWDHPPELVIWKQHHFDRARQILSHYSQYPLWGFKDPRSLITFDGWHRLLPDLELVGIFRHPTAVAKSLYTRNSKTSIADGLDLWLCYNKRLLELYDANPFPILCFDQSFEKLRSQLVDLCEQLDLPYSAGIDFFDDSLVNHQEEETSDLPAPIISLYQNLRSVAFH